MKTITNWVKGINTKLKKAPRLGIWKVLYLPEFRRVILHGDGLPLFKGVISKDGKFVFVEFIVQRVPRFMDDGSTQSYKYSYKYPTVVNDIHSCEIISRKTFERRVLGTAGIIIP